MATVDTSVNELVINKLTQAQYDALTEKSPTELYFITDAQDGSLPDQTDNEGKFLTTDGTTVSWSDKPLVNTATGTKSISVMTATATGGGAIAIGNNSGNYSTGAQATKTGAIAIGGGSSQGIYCARALGENCIAIGPRSTAGENRKFSAIAIGESSTSTGNQSIAIGLHTNVTGQRSVLIGSNEQGYMYSITENDTMYFQNNNGQFKLLNSDGTIPTDRYTTTPATAGTYVPKLTIAEDGTTTREWGTESGGTGGSSSQVNELPDASLNTGKVVQYVGESTDTLTNGYFYKAGQSDPLTVEITNFESYGFSTASVEVGDFNLFIEKFGDAYGTYILKADDSFFWSLQKPDGTYNSSAPTSYGINLTIDDELQTTRDAPLAASSGDLEITIVYTAPGGFVWKNIEVQTVDIKKQLPSLSSGANKFLMTDGVDLYWEQVITPDSYAMKSRAGVIRPSSTYGTTMASVQYLAAEVKTQDQYDTANDKMFISKGTLDNVLESYMLAPVPPTDNGTYVLKATVVDGVVTTEWVLEA